MTTPRRQLRSRKSALLVLAFMTVVYVGGTIFGLWMAADTHRRMDTLRPIPGGIVTNGAIVRADEHCSKSCWWDPHIQWTDRHGAVHEFKGVSYSDRPLPGATVRVSYDPAHPTIAHEISRSPSILDPPLYTGYAIAATASIIGVIVLVAMIPQIRKLPWKAPPATADASLAQLPPPPEQAVRTALVKQIRATMVGLFTGAVTISTFGVVIGLGNHAPWLGLVWLGGLVCLFLSGRTVIARCHDEALDAEALSSWWRPQGALTLMASTMPAMATTVIAIILISGH